MNESCEAKNEIERLAPQTQVDDPWKTNWKINYRLSTSAPLSDAVSLLDERYAEGADGYAAIVMIGSRSTEFSSRPGLVGRKLGRREIPIAFSLGCLGRVLTWVSLVWTRRTFAATGTSFLVFTEFSSARLPFGRANRDPLHTRVSSLPLSRNTTSQKIRGSAPLPETEGS